MTDPTEDYFARLGTRRHERRLEALCASIRFDIESDQRVDRWLVEIRKGDIHVSRELRDADCIIHIKRGLFDRIATGVANLSSAWLRHELRVEGQLPLMQAFRRLLPGPATAHRRAPAATRRPQP